MIETKNAEITDTMLGWEDHGIFTFMLSLDYGDSGQGAGQYSLDKFVDRERGRVGTADGMSMIMAVIKTVGVETWEDLKGKKIRVKCDYNKVHAIGHYLKDKWLDFQEFYDKRKDVSQV